MTLNESELNLPLAINYEGGKIIEHILSNRNCIGYANLQIGMDAPFLGIVADDKVRSLGRTEKLLPEYDQHEHKNEIKEILTLIKNDYLEDGKINLIIQIARGKSSKQTADEILIPILYELNILSYEIFFGYRKENYAKIDSDKKFVFLNYGMIARLTDIDKIKSGTICNPIQTLDITNYDKIKQIFNIETIRNHIEDKNILNKFHKFPKIKLYGINDNMPFITPKDYDNDVFKNLLVSNGYTV